MKGAYYCRGTADALGICYDRGRMVFLVDVEKA